MKRDLEQEGEELREQKAALIDEIAYKDGQLYELQDAVVSKEIEIDQLKSEVKRQRSTIDRQADDKRAGGASGQGHRQHHRDCGHDALALRAAELAQGAFELVDNPIARRPRRPAERGSVGRRTREPPTKSSSAR